MRIVITDSKYKMAVAPARALHAAGYEVCCGDYADLPAREGLASRSKSCAAALTWPRGGESAINIADACREGDVVLPVGRATLQSFAEHPALSEKVRFLVSSPEVLALADDKARIQALAAELGIPTPRTEYLPPDGDLEAFAAQLRYPCIIKYRNGEALGLKSHERYAVARDAAALVREYRRMDAVSPSPLVQEYLSGRDVGAAIVMDGESRPVDFLLYESEQEYPLAGGPTCLCRTVFDRDLLRHACTLLRAIGFRGIAMLDFKGSVREPHLLEINPRVWGSAALVNVAHSTFCESYVDAALGTARPLDLERCAPTYRVGARMKFMPHCLLASAAQLRAGDLRSAGRGLAASLSPRVSDGLFSARDPKPFLRYLANLV